MSSVILVLSIALFASAAVTGCAKADPDKDGIIQSDASAEQPAPEVYAQPTASDSDTASVSADAAAQAADSAATAATDAAATPTDAAADAAADVAHDSAVEDTPNTEPDDPPKEEDPDRN